MCNLLPMILYDLIFDEQYKPKMCVFSKLYNMHIAPFYDKPSNAAKDITDVIFRLTFLQSLKA